MPRADPSRVNALITFPLLELFSDFVLSIGGKELPKLSDNEDLCIHVRNLTILDGETELLRDIPEPSSI